MLRQNDRAWMETAITSLIVIMAMQALVSARPRPHHGYYMRIREIAKDTSTPEKKSGVVAELIRIARNDAENVHLRQFAVEELGELGAVEAKGYLKGLAEGLEWSDTARQLKWAAFLAYWRTEVAEASQKEQQETLLSQALHEKLQGIIASNVQIWAANELSNRGAKDALPEIIRSTQFRDSTNRGEEFILLCKTKIELLTASGSRIEALTRAIAVNDFTERQQLRRWAIDELAKLGSDESRSILIKHAVILQSRYYDAGGKRLRPPPDRLAGYAGEFYRRIIGILEDGGMSKSVLAQAGLHPDQFFTVSP